MSTSHVTSITLPTLPTLSIPVPRSVTGRLAAARADGVTAAREFIAANPDANDASFAAFLIRRAGGPPEGTVQQAELRMLHRIQDRRTPEHDAQAVWVDEHGLFDLWNAHFDGWKDTVGPEQAARGAEILARSRDLTKTVTFALKDSFNRPRPFLADPTLKLVDGVTHVSNGSFPSGHASEAFSDSAVLSLLWPERASRFAHDAVQASFARSYAAAHFPSDLATGAFVGAAVGAWITGHERPPA